ncbi:hypothetical protein [Streptomyces sp. NBC_00140]|uniref:hypothetical protein n=1 Tax=Streptomyces sp. NBC_00140 TaxID=2975664 RepID=UPI0022543CCC|nr:hypothetical protein [Streptomyces sp. NBC_00140]MCX5331415.1 hypothetical protein [Streptomyces sp. NBC_00140]
MTRRPRLWRWVVIVWAAVVAVAGGLTWLLQDSAGPQEPKGWAEFSPRPSLPEGWEEQCGLVTSGPADEEAPDALCFIRTR